MPLFFRSALLSTVGLSLSAFLLLAQAPTEPQHVFGYRDFSAQAKIDQQFLAVPSAKLAGEELKTLTAAPHIAASKEDYDTAVYVAGKFKAAGLETSIVPYKAWLNLPKEISVTATDDATGKTLMHGPTREHVEGDPYQDDPRVTPGFNGSSPSGDVTAEVVYANYGRPEDFDRLAALHIDVKGKLVIVRYGANFRGVKVYVAQQRGAAGVIIYSDPADDGYYRGDKYPNGPYRPDTGVQRGSVQYMFKYPGDATTPGIASTPELPASKRIDPATAASMPRIPSTPLSYHDAAPILENLGGPSAPREWQGALPFNYHLGGTGVKVHMLLKQDYAMRTIWDVIGKIPGTELPDEWVVAGNHRDAWVYGAVDPNSGTAAMLESVHGIGELLHQGWKPKRTVIFASWDAEEEGLIGSTEWAEDHANQLAHAVAYFNTDVGVSGPSFESAAVPSLKQFVRDVTKEVPSPKGGSVYEQWKAEQAANGSRHHVNNGFNERHGHANVDNDVEIGDLGSGSDYTPFIQHLGVPSTDIGSDGPYGVYHSVFDNYAWFIKNADPTFVYEQQQARVFGLEVLHMADTDVLPYDYVTYGKEIEAYIEAAKKKAADAQLSSIDFSEATAAAQKFTSAAEAAYSRQTAESGNPTHLNSELRQVEGDLLSSAGLPNRPWFKHTIYAPGEYTGYAAVVIPGVNEAIDAKDVSRAQTQMATLTAALTRATSTLESAAK
ncbi:M28 family metallopeptidase [Acidipila rosea]|uniref:M28 family metallopeptidase n=1 Tax=Acidipila rosea TaxID=768535 RepID=UPI0010449884